MQQVRSLARTYGFDLLIALAALEIALEVALRDDLTREPTTTRWFTVPAMALVVLSLLGRRRFPFAAPAAVWLLAAGLSFLDGRLVGFTATASIAGMVAAFLLGNLRNDTEARVGLTIVIAAAAIVVYNTPGHAPGELVFIPVLFAIGWLAGFALRERSVQAEDAEERALRAEREREAAARLAVAEERARIARELHDIVAHSVSVIVLQVGAVRH
jgi:signal transduction histidine kinase